MTGGAVRDEPLRAVVSPRWHHVLHADVLNCPAESLCGRIIDNLCHRADALLELVRESDTASAIQAAIRHETDVVWFG
jgi:hypothetical protein